MRCGACYSVSSREPGQLHGSNYTERVSRLSGDQHKNGPEKLNDVGGSRRSCRIVFIIIESSLNCRAFSHGTFAIIIVDFEWWYGYLLYGATWFLWRKKETFHHPVISLHSFGFRFLFFVFISLKWPNISFFLKIKESEHLFFFFWLLHFLPVLWPNLFSSSYWILWIYLSIYLSYWEMMLLLLLGHRSCLPAAAEACVHVVYIDGILSSCRYIPIIVYYKYLEEWKILDERETKGYKYSNASMRLCVVGSPPFPPVWLFVGVPFELSNGWEAEWQPARKSSSSSP